MKTTTSLTMILALVVLMMPFVIAGIPADVEDYCNDFDMKECNEHSSWFETDGCKSPIRCNSIIDMDGGFEFKECRTQLQFVMDDCENNPSALCFNNIAYDISHSESCKCGGIRFKEIDSCGNALDWGECMDIDSCNDRSISPHTGSVVIIKENCDYVDQDCDEDYNPRKKSIEEKEYGIPELYDEDEEQEVEDEHAAGSEEQAGNEESSLTSIIEKIAEANPNKTITPKIIVGPGQEQEPEHNIAFTVFTIVIALLFLIVVVAWIYVSYFKR